MTAVEMVVSSTRSLRQEATQKDWRGLLLFAVAKTVSVERDPARGQTMLNRGGERSDSLGCLKSNMCWVGDIFEERHGR